MSEHQNWTDEVDADLSAPDSPPPALDQAPDHDPLPPTPIESTDFEAPIAPLPSQTTPETQTLTTAETPGLADVQAQLHQLIARSLLDLEAKRSSLIAEIEKLERRRERVQTELKQNFVGASQDLAIRVQGFKDYLVNSLQDLAVTAEQLELTPATAPAAPATPTPASTPEGKNPAKLHLAEESFHEESRRINKLIEQYRQNPNYYGPAWQLRRTFEPIHAERVETWFFDLGGRGALRSMNSRLQNILVASAIISILRDFYDDTLRVLILADSPERLGDWRRGLQDCLGITRTDFGPDRGVALFESAEALAFRADRLEQDDYLPLILVDDSQEAVSLSMLQFPLLLGFAPEPQLRQPRSGGLDFFE